MVNTELRDRLREWNRALAVRELDPSDAEQARYYMQLNSPGEAAIDEIAAAIELSIDIKSVHLVSGPRGSGKSSELLRLRRSLEARGFRVVYFDALDYVSEVDSLDIEILLIVMGLAVSEALDPQAGSMSFSDRIRSWIGEWRPTDLKGEAKLDAGPVSFGLTAAFERELSGEIRSNPNFVAWLKDQTRGHLSELKQRVDQLVEELAREHGGGEPIVVIVDSLEKIGGTVAQAQAAESTARIFVDHPHRLVFPRVHAVYTVPPIAPVLFPGFANLLGDGVLHQIAVPRVATLSTDSSVPIETFAEALDRRLGSTTDLVTAADRDRVIHASGGHLDDLYNLMRRVINLVLARSSTVPASSQIVDAAIADIRGTLSPRTAEQQTVIEWVAEHGHDDLPPQQMASQLAGLLATHLVLHRRNDHDWYEAHPLTLEAIGYTTAGA